MSTEERVDALERDLASLRAELGRRGVIAVPSPVVARPTGSVASTSPTTVVNAPHPDYSSRPRPR